MPRPSKKQVLGAAFGAAIYALLMIVGYLLWFREAGPRVVRLEWERVVSVEKSATRSGAGWKNEVPAGAKILTAEPRFHHDEKKVLGMHQAPVPGDGGPVMETRPTVERTRVEMDWCTWEVEEWVPVRDEKRAGAVPEPPLWPTPTLAPGERDRVRRETFRAIVKRKGMEETVEMPFDRWSSLKVGDRLP